MLPKAFDTPTQKKSETPLGHGNASSGNGSSSRFVPRPPLKPNPAANGQGVAQKFPPQMLARLSTVESQPEQRRSSDSSGSYRNSYSSGERGSESDNGAPAGSSRHQFDATTPAIRGTASELNHAQQVEGTARLAHIKLEIGVLCLDDHPDPGAYAALAIKAAREIKYIAELERLGSSSSTPEPNRLWIQESLSSTLPGVLPHLNDSQLAQLEQALESIGRNDLQATVETQRDQNWDAAMLASRACAAEAIAAVLECGQPGGSIAEVASAFYAAASTADEAVQHFDDASDREKGRASLLRAFSAQLNDEVQKLKPEKKAVLGQMLNAPATLELAAAAHALALSYETSEHPGLRTQLRALGEELDKLRGIFNPGPRQGPPPPPVRLHALRDGVPQALRVYGIDVSGQPRVVLGIAATGAQNAIRQSIDTALQTQAAAWQDEAQFDNWNSSIAYNGRDSRERFESPVEFEYTDELRELFPQLEPAQQDSLSRLAGPQVLRAMQAAMSSPSSPLRLPGGAPGEVVGRYKMTMDLRPDGKGGYGLHAQLDISEANSFVAAGRPPRQVIALDAGRASIALEIPLSWDGVVDTESIVTRFNFDLTPSRSSTPTAVQPLVKPMPQVSPSSSVQRTQSRLPLTKGEKQIQRALTHLSIPFAEESDLDRGDADLRSAIRTQGHTGRNAAQAFTQDALPLLDKMLPGRLAALLENLERLAKINPSSKEEFRTLRDAAEKVLYGKVSPGTRRADLIRTQAVLEATQGDTLNASTLFNWFGRKLINENDLFTRFRQLSTPLLQVVVDSDIDTGAIDRVANAVLSERAASSPKGFIVRPDDRIRPPPAEDPPEEDPMAELNRVLAYERSAAAETPPRPYPAQPGMSGPVAFAASAPRNVESAPRRPPPLEINSGDVTPVPASSPQRSPGTKWLDKKGRPLSREASVNRTLAFGSVRLLTSTMLPSEKVPNNVDYLRKEKLPTLKPLLAEKTVAELTTFARNIREGATPKQLKKKDVKALLAAIQAEIDGKPQRASIPVSLRLGEESQTPSLVSASRDAQSPSITASLARKLSFTDSVGLQPPITPSRSSQSPRSSSSLSTPTPTIVSANAVSEPGKRLSGVGKFFTRLAGVLSPRKSTAISEAQRQANIQEVGLALKELGRTAANSTERTAREVDGLVMLGRLENQERFTEDARNEYIAANLDALTIDELAAIQLLVLSSVLGPRATSSNPLFERNEWLVALAPAVARALEVRFSAAGADAIQMEPALAGLLVKASAIPAGRNVYTSMLAIAGSVLGQYGLEDNPAARRQLVIDALAHQLANGQVRRDQLKAIFMTLDSDEMLAVSQSRATRLDTADAHVEVVALCGQAIADTHRATAAALEGVTQELGNFDANSIGEDMTVFATWVISAARALQRHALHGKTHHLEEFPSVSDAMGNLKQQFGGQISIDTVALADLPAAEFREFVVGLQSLGLVDGDFVETTIEARKTAVAGDYVDSMERALLSVKGFDLSEARKSLELAWRSAPAIAQAWNDLSDEDDRLAREDLVQQLHPELIRHAVDRLSRDDLETLSGSLRAPLLLKMAEKLRQLDGDELLPRAASYLGKASGFINRLALLQVAVAARMRAEDIAEPVVEPHNPDVGPVLASEFGIEIGPDGNVNVVEGIAEDAAQRLFKEQLFSRPAPASGSRFQLQGSGDDGPVQFDVPQSLLDSLNDPSVDYEVRTGEEASSLGKLQTMRISPVQTAATSLFEMTGRDPQRWDQLSKAVDAQNTRRAIGALMASRDSPVVRQDGTPGTVVGDTNIKITVTNEDNGDQTVRYVYNISNLSHFTPFDGGPSTVLESTGKVEFNWTHRITRDDADISIGLKHKRDWKQIREFMPAFSRVELEGYKVDEKGVLKSVPAFVDAVVAAVAAYRPHKARHDTRGMPLDPEAYDRFRDELRPLVEQGVMNRGPLPLIALHEDRRNALEGALREMGLDQAANTLRLQAHIDATAQAALLFLRGEDERAKALLLEKVHIVGNDRIKVRKDVIKAALVLINESEPFMAKTAEGQIGEVSRALKAQLENAMP